MTIIKSLSGIRGTLKNNEIYNFSPMEVIKISYGFAYWIKKKFRKKQIVIIIGKDGRLTSNSFYKLIMHTLCLFGINIIDIGLSTTPTLGISVITEKANGGIMITASHNSNNWNGIKIFNSYGEFLYEQEFKEFIKIINTNKYKFSFKKIGNIYKKKNYIDIHIKKILSLPIVNVDLIKASSFKVVVDGINSTGGIAIPILLEKLGITVIKFNCIPNGHFSHNPEPIKENLEEICKKVKELKADFGISVDPDVDRVVFICENGDFFGEEYTLTSIADYVLTQNIGPVVTTLSSSRILQYIAIKRKIPCYYSAVGEINVVNIMKKKNAVIGGEGNGGIIYPKLRYGRDALMGIALFLTYLSTLKNVPLSILKKKYACSFISKKKIKFSLCYNKMLEMIQKKYINYKIDLSDGIKIFFEDDWVHIRKSNTEEKIRIYAESISKSKADYISKKVINEIYKL